ncbi:MAG: L,D-transpeptidase [Bryobacteraceae bacterium]|nr:L,D-transpeptidase [Bryobacteraceae bacterium]
MKLVICVLATFVFCAGAGPAQKNAKQNLALVDAQVRLARAHFSPGEIDGQKGENFSRALRGFQASQGLDVTGQLDKATLSALATDTAAVMTAYTITEGDVAGPYVSEVPADLAEQAKLESLGYTSIQEALAERFHISPGLLRQLNPKAKFAAGESLQVPDVGAPLTGVKAVRVVVRKDGTLTAYGADKKAIVQYPCSSGSERDPLPVGAWKVTGVAKNPPFFYNPELFWDADPTHTKAKIAAGPNNPVGVVWIDISKEHYGIHGTPQPGGVGHTQSHGCIRLTNWDAMELAGIVARGIPVVCEE